MSSRTSRALVVILVISACSASAADWESFVAASDRRDDGTILEILQGSDFQTQVAICQTLGQRSDPYAANILSWLLSRFSKTGEYRTEHLLRLAISSLFDPVRGDQVLHARLDANAEVIGEMVRHIAAFQDPQLKGIIVGLLPGLGSPDRLRALMDVGAGIIDRLEETRGRLSAPDTGLALEYLALAKQIGDADFLEPCLAIARLSRDPALVQRAREASKLMAGLQR